VVNTVLRPALLATLLVAPAAHAQTVVLVRHAEKAASPAADPPLTPAGRARAEALAERLSGARVSTVLSSQLARTRETAAPLAARAGAPVTVAPINGSLNEHLLATVALARRAPADSTVVIVGHSNTIPLLARALGMAAPPSIPDCRYDLLLRIDLSAPEKATAEHYGAASSC
jgi:broad specificity phosphatase PhoE